MQVYLNKRTDNILVIKNCKQLFIHAYFLEVFNLKAALHTVKINALNFVRRIELNNIFIEEKGEDQIRLS